MSHLGDFDAAAVLYGKFATYRPSTGATFALGGSAALSVYKDNSTTQSTTGVTLTVDFDSVTGLNHFAIDTSADGSFYAAGSFFDIVITTGTVDSVSVVGSVVGSFTIRKNSALKPTTAARTLDVSAGGEAGVDWANVGSPTTTLALTGTTVATTQKVDVETIKTQAVTAAAGVTFPTSIASPTNITAGTISTATNVTTVNGLAAGVITATSIAADAITDAKVASDVTIASVTGSVGSVTGNVGGNVVGSVGSVTAAVGLSVGDSPVMQSGTATAGGGSTITIQTALGADSLPVGSVIKITSGTGANQARVITAYVNATKVVTVDRAWTTNPDNTSVYSILYAENTALGSSLKVSGVVLTDTLTTYTGNTPQTGDAFARLGAPAGASVSADVAAVKSDTAAVKTKTDFLPSATAGAAGGVFIAGTNAATTITTALTTTFTGNLTGSVGSVSGLTAATVHADLDDIQTRLPAALVSGRIDASVGAMAANVMTAAAAAADLTTELQTGLATQASVDDLPTNAELATALGTADDAVLAILGTPAGASLSADVAAVKTQTAAIEVDTADIQTRLPAALVSGRMDSSVGAMAANVMTAAAAAADLTTELQTGLATQASVNTIDDFLDTEIAAIKAATDLLGTPAGASHAADIAAIKAQTAAIETDTQDIQSRLPAALVSGRIDASVGAIAANVITAAATAADFTTEVTAGLDAKLDTIDNFLDTEVAAIKAVTDKLDDTVELTSDGWVFTIEALENGGGASAADIADAVWEEDLSDHSGTSGSTAEALAAAGSAGDPWITALPGAYSAGQAGYIVGTNVNATISSRATQASVDAIQADTDNIQTRLPAALVSGRIDASVGAMAANVMTAAAAAADLTTELQAGLATQTSVDDLPTNAELATALGTADDAVLVQVALVKAKTDLIPADPAETSDLSQVAADAAWLRELADDTVIVGTIGAASSTTSLVTSALSPAGAVADQFKGRIVVFDSDTATAALRGQATDITANTSAATPTLTVTALTTAPASGDTFHIV